MSNWNNNSIQFPRLLSEIYANIELTEEQWTNLCNSMDLSQAEILEIMERADNVWQDLKNKEMITTNYFED